MIKISVDMAERVSNLYLPLRLAMDHSRSGGLVDAAVRHTKRREARYTERGSVRRAP
jgi:hypothetical protein